MANLNKVMLMGNLTRDPEMKYTSSNTAIANFGLAINRRWVTPEGEKKEETTFVDCEAYGRTAENIGKFLQKGRPLFVEGRLKLDQWTDKNDNSKRSKMKVVVENFQFIDSGKGQAGGGSGGGDEAGGGDERPAPRVQTRPAGRPAQQAAPEITEDDIPF
jgi:single-strand DNA-binding protein